MGRDISSSVNPHLLVFQKAGYSFKKRPQCFLVVFAAGEFAESHPLLLIRQIGQVSCGINSCTASFAQPSALHRTAVNLAILLGDRSHSLFAGRSVGSEVVHLQQ